MATSSENLYRLAFLLLVVTALVMSGIYRRRARKVSGTIPRLREGKGFLAARLIAGSVLFLGILAYALAPQWMAWARLPLPDWLRWPGAVVGLASLGWLHLTFRAIGGNISETFLTKPDHRLVTQGPYRWVRHPLYAGSLALLAGLGLLVASGWILLTTGLALVAMAIVVVPREEAELILKFGQDYRDYRRRVGGLFPRLSPSARGLAERIARPGPDSG